MLDYEKLQSKSALEMRPSGIRKFFDLVMDMPECISLGVGEPDFQTPWTIRESAIHSLELGRTKYTANAGLKQLRAAISTFMKRKYDLEYSIDEMIVTSVDLRQLIWPSGL